MPDRWQFNILARILHWTMAAMILTMLFIGVAQVASLADYHLLLSIHRPLGIAVLILVVLRFINRKLSTLPAFPATMSHIEREVAKASEYLMYGLMFVLPLVGWGMLSAGITRLFCSDRSTFPGSFRTIWSCIGCCGRRTRFLLFSSLRRSFAHFGAILFHTLVVRDGMLKRMVPWNISRQSAEPR